ncbi:gluconate 2-dehydrogenase subunit 3 family protein [Mesobacillus foraminis]|uniref:Gluconate 2-dehydrogenase gamma chain n=1 Tax=Mesobacillus foraminis TaxID=279826 RepID=A0A4R2BKL7_9BACI|nr:gluconate 2-dehydrogenase subunit 3 family protein [Mesobacillus foraminis]TCN27082.1 gluconate 2-dehydrogenase gamma chain [Mesobacillus foraminis]
MSEKEKVQNEKKYSRRTFMKNSGLTVGGLVLGGAVGSLFGKSESQPAVGHIQKPAAENHNQALMYFTPDQFSVVDAACEAIFPKTETGPGAKELLVAYYVDHQLAGSFGLNTKEYMSGPFHLNEAVPEQGYQTHLNRQQVFDLGIQALNDEANKRFKAKFPDIKEEEQIEILTDFEADKVKIKGAVSSQFFFALLRKVTLEGVYADPMYGGNKDMAGWKMKNFPGHQGAYATIIDKDKFAKIEPKSLHSQHNH